MAESSEASGIFRNTLAQSAPVVTTFVFSFALAPVMLSKLGLAQFGVWAVTGALAQYARLLDLGITGSMSRFVALHDAAGERRKVEETIGVGVIATLAVTVVVLALAAVAAPLVVDLIGVLDVSEMRIVLLSSAGISGAFLVSAVLAAVPVGLRQMGPPNVAQTAGNVANFAFSLAALLLSSELAVYALANLAAAILSLIFTAFALAWVWPRPYLRRPSGGHARTILGFGVKSQLVTLANLVNVQTDKVIIAAMLGPRTAGAYEIGNRIVQGVLSLGLLTLSALIPTATADIVKRGSTVIGEYFTRYTVRSLAVALPMFGAICVSVPYLLVAWLGETPEDSVAIVILLSLAFSVSLATGVAMTLVVSDGHPGMVAQTATVVVVLNVAGTVGAAPIFGLWGVLIATVVAELIASVVFMVRFRRRYLLPARDFVAAIARPALVAVGVAVPFGLWYLLGGPVPDSRGPAVIGAVLTAGGYGLLCYALESRQGLLPERLRASYLRRRFASG
jgi:O-antigen/teichoic acid export membrane protein